MLLKITQQKILGNDYGVGTGKYNIKTEIADLAETGDYNLDPGSAGEKEFYQYTGDKTFAKDPLPKKKFDTKSIASNIAKGLLNKSDTPAVKPYYMGQTRYDYEYYIRWIYWYRYSRFWWW